MLLLAACPRLAAPPRRVRCCAVRRCARLPPAAAPLATPRRLPPLRAAAAEAPEPPPEAPARQTPGLAEANVAYCVGCLWLLFLTDLSGIGSVLLSSDNVPLSLAALQWVRRCGVHA
jgi:hypothetical protein